MTLSNIPSGLWLHFQEYDVRTLAGGCHAG
jgi:hypothetical protein